MGAWADSVNEAKARHAEKQRRVDELRGRTAPKPATKTKKKKGTK